MVGVWMEPVTAQVMMTLFEKLRLLGSDMFGIRLGFVG
jgi:hypothetical protein